MPERSIEDPHVGLGNGYGESKWVSERILDVAAQKTPLEPVVVRIGQLCGSTINGHWNPWEWFPAIVRSSRALKCLPDSEGVSPSQTIALRGSDLHPHSDRLVDSNRRRSECRRRLPLLAVPLRAPRAPQARVVVRAYAVCIARHADPDGQLC